MKGLKTMNEENKSNEEKNKALKKDFRYGQFIYIGIYLTLLVMLVMLAYK
tara:strand:+ start:181 stop:330 length:150 start_codon:yes stop_codon:yes gene_type:complete